MPNYVTVIAKLIIEGNCCDKKTLPGEEITLRYDEYLKLLKCGAVCPLEEEEITPVGADCPPVDSGCCPVVIGEVCYT